MTPPSLLASIFESAEVVIFDCDGVLLNSNKVKTEAFESTVSCYGKEATTALVKHHVENGGVSRYKKLAYFVDEILPSAGVCIDSADRDLLIDGLVSTYASIVKNELIDCEYDKALWELRELNPNSRWCVVSGGDETELRHVFLKKGLAHLFDGEVYGSPRDKRRIIRDQKLEMVQGKVLFIGDSRLDHQVAKDFDMDFVFISHWTEFQNWASYCEDNSVTTAVSLADFLTHTDFLNSDQPHLGQRRRLTKIF